jgi:hypothetical protein
VKASRNYGLLTEILQNWSELHLNAKRKTLTWDSARLLVRSARILDRYAQQHLQDALAFSDAEFSPLTEPLRLNLGEHRWLSADREESYSDWLAWILQGMSGTGEILTLFARSDEVAGDMLGPVGKVRREESSEHGRTDVEVPLGKRGLLLIEVKVRNAGGELSAQLKRYAQKVVDQHVERPLLVLLGTEAPDPSVPLFEFAFTHWRTLCQRLRQYANRAKRTDVLRAAAILIFCGAAEQNLLGLSGQPRGLRAIATINYLREWGCEV